MNIQRPLSKQPIPKNATRVFKGKIFDVYQWPQKQFDGSVATYEKIKRLDSVETVAIFNGKILVAKEQQPGVKPFQGVIAGKIDEGENPLEAAKRELLEETGMEASRWEFWFATQPTQKID